MQVRQQIQLKIDCALFLRDLDIGKRLSNAFLGISRIMMETIHEYPNRIAPKSLSSPQHNHLFPV